MLSFSPYYQKPKNRVRRQEGGWAGGKQGFGEGFVFIAAQVHRLLAEH